MLSPDEAEGVCVFSVTGVFVSSPVSSAGSFFGAAETELSPFSVVIVASTPDGESETGVSRVKSPIPGDGSFILSPLL